MGMIGAREEEGVNTLFPVVGSDYVLTDCFRSYSSQTNIPYTPYLPVPFHFGAIFL